MNDIDSMPPKCHDCPYWEMCEEPYICQPQNESVEPLMELRAVITGRPTLKGNAMKRNHWERGEFSKAVVIYCIRWMTAVLVWAVIMTTIAAITDRTIYLTEVLTFASAFFGGELCLLALKRILAKERNDNGEVDTDYQSDHSAGDGIDYDVSDPVPAEEDDADGMGDNSEYY